MREKGRNIPGAKSQAAARQTDMRSSENKIYRKGKM